MSELSQQARGQRRGSRAVLVVGALCATSTLTVLPAQADTATLYVEGGNSACSDTGTGTAAAPFCTIQAGVDAAAPGDTVEVSDPPVQGYKAPVTISASGTAAAPIDIVANPATQSVDTGYPFIFQVNATPSFTFSGAHYIDFSGFGILNYTQTGVIAVQDSSNITIDTVGFREGSGDVSIDGASRGITITRSMLGGISIGSGASGITLAEDNLDALAPIAATDVDGLTVTNDTILRGCGSGVDVEGTSQNVSIENNIISDNFGVGPGLTGEGANCSGGTGTSSTAAGAEVTVSAGSAPNTTSDYNDIFTLPSNESAVYSWNGTVYQTLAPFTTATGQGVNDIAGDPWPSQNLPNSYASNPNPLDEGSPAIDSGNANAPGIQPTDFYGQAPVDDPYVPNTGTGSGYVDRGAFEFVSPAGTPATVTLSPTTGTYPLTVTAKATLPSAWGGAQYSFNFNGTGWTAPSYQSSAQYTYNGQIGTINASVQVRETMNDATATAQYSTTLTVTPSSVPLTPALGVDSQAAPPGPVAVTASGAATTDGAPIASYSFDFGDGTAPVVVPASQGDSATHRMAIGTYTISETVTDVLGRTASVSQKVIVSTTAPLAASLKVTEGAPSGGNVPVTLDPTATTDGAPIASYSFDFGDGTAPVVVTAATTTPQTRLLPLGMYAPSLTVTDAYGRSQTMSTTVTVGAGYHAYGPTRLMDTRHGTGVRAGAVPAKSTVKLKLPAAVLGTVNSPTVAVVLNVTVTQPTASGNITVYPDGVARPSTSNLNYVNGETVANQVTVPVGADGMVDFTVNGSGSTQLIADIDGFYALGTGSGYAGDGPKRVLDTRSGLGAAKQRVASQGTLVLTLPTSVVPVGATAAVMNVTVVNPSAGGDLSVYPDGTARPNSSNLNFVRGDTVPNLVVVPIVNGKIDFHLDSPGNADLVADVSGYFSSSSTSMLLPFVPTRLVDTRQGGPLPGGAIGGLNLAEGLGLSTTTLSAALYNVTVTQPASNGFMTVYPDGTARPNASNLNFVAGQTVPNAVLSPLTDGISDFYNGGAGPTQLIVDLFGVFAPSVAPVVQAQAAAVHFGHSGVTARSGAGLSAHPGVLSTLG